LPLPSNPASIISFPLVKSVGELSLFIIPIAARFVTPQEGSHQVFFKRFYFIPYFLSVRPSVSLFLAWPPSSCTDHQSNLCFLWSSAQALQNK
jgi:hypothetical protein